MQTPKIFTGLNMKSLHIEKIFTLLLSGVMRITETEIFHFLTKLINTSNTITSVQETPLFRSEDGKQAITAHTSAVFHQNKHFINTRGNLIDSTTKVGDSILVARQKFLEHF